MVQRTTRITVETDTMSWSFAAPKQLSPGAPIVAPRWTSSLSPRTASWSQPPQPKWKRGFAPASCTFGGTAKAQSRFA